MKALKLDSSYRPVDIIDAVEALVLCLVGKAHSVESYSEEIHSVSESFKLPAVIVLKRYVKFQFTSMVCNREMSYGEIKINVNTAAKSMKVLN